MAHQIVRRGTSSPVVAQISVRRLGAGRRPRRRGLPRRATWMCQKRLKFTLGCRPETVTRLSQIRPTTSVQIRASRPLNPLAATLAFTASTATLIGDRPGRSWVSHCPRPPIGPALPRAQVAAKGCRLVDRVTEGCRKELEQIVHRLDPRGADGSCGRFVTLPPPRANTRPTRCGRPSRSSRSSAFAQRPRAREPLSSHRRAQTG